MVACNGRIAHGLRHETAEIEREAMRVFLTGATGFLGRALTLALRRDGHAVRAWVRSPERARDQLGHEAELVAVDRTSLRDALTGCDAVVNLAGEPILSRWTAPRRAAL